MLTQFLNMTLPALIGSAVTFSGILLSNKVKNRKINYDIDVAQDSVWMDLVRQSRIEYALQRKENNRLRYITHHLQEEIAQLEQKNVELMNEIIKLRTQGT